MRVDYTMGGHIPVDLHSETRESCSRGGGFQARRCS